MKPVDWDKPIRARAGDDILPARLIGKVCGRERCCVVAITRPLIGEVVWFTCESGMLDVFSSLSRIENIPERCTRWINMHESQDGSFMYYAAHDSKVAADVAGTSSTPRRIACIKVEFEEGEGL